MKEPWSASLPAREGPAGPCLDDEAIVAFYSDELDDERAAGVRQHLAECRPCLELAGEARRFLKAMDAGGVTDVAESVSRPARGRWWTFAAAAAVVFTVGWWWVRSPTPDGPPPRDTALPESTRAVQPHPWADLRVPKAPYSSSALPGDLVWREGAGTPPPAVIDPFDEAMRAYERDDFAEAERRLAAVVAREPRRSEAHFYRGVCLLTLGRTQDAVASLEQARTLGDADRREDAAFYLALAHLKADAPARALPLLETLRHGHRHGREAERLRQEVLAALGARD